MPPSSAAAPAVAPETPTVAPTPAVAWRAQFAALAVMWGSSFLCIKVLGRHWAAPDVALGRVALGAVFLVGLMGVRRLPLPRGRIWLHIAVVAMLMNAVPFTLFAYGETKISSVLAGLWNATTPLTTMVVLLTVMREEPLDARRLAGLVGGFMGVALLLGPWHGLGGGHWLGHLACLGGAICYGLGVPYARRHLAGRPESGVSIAAGQLLCATLVLLLVLPLAGTPSLRLGAGPWASLIVLGVLGSGVAYVLMHAIVRAAGASRFSTVTYVIPVVSTTLGVVLLSEPLSWNEPVGAAVVLGAMWWSSGARRVQVPWVWWGRARTSAHVHGP
jgi:drug/metabolite transporter (DMT)-like permease